MEWVLISLGVGAFLLYKKKKQGSTVAQVAQVAQSAQETARNLLANGDPPVTEITRIAPDKVQELYNLGGYAPPSVPYPGMGGITNWGWILPKPPDGMAWDATAEEAAAGNYRLVPIGDVLGPDGNIRIGQSATPTIAQDVPQDVRMDTAGQDLDVTALNWESSSAGV